MEQLENSFEVQALTRNFGTLLYRKLIPQSLFTELKANGEVWYNSREDLEDMDEFDSEPGWQLSNAGMERIVAYAEKIATDEHRAAVARLTAAREAAEKEQKVRAEKRAEAVRLAKEIAELDRGAKRFEIAKGAEKYRPQGEEIEHPQFQHNIYGGGRWWVIEQDRVLSVYNNGSDGDDWGVNTIATGGAGAYGYVLEKTNELVKKLRRIRELEAAE